MENVKEIIAQNLVSLRKSRHWTQQELAEKLAYSDKAVSRWEHAETLPDIETLCKICELYGVRFEYLLQKEQPKNNPYLVKNNIGVRVLVMFIAICSVWIAALLAYMGVQTVLSKNVWTVFMWAIPTSAIVCQTYNRLYFGSRALKCVMHSILNWTLLLAIYLELIQYNMWMLFLVGIPIQAVIVLMTVVKIKTGADYNPKKRREELWRSE